MSDSSQIQSDLRRSSFLRGGVKAALGLAGFSFLLKTSERSANADNAYSPEVANSLNFLLSFEYLTQRFYEQAEATAGLVPQSAQGAVAEIRKHEAGHVNSLKGLLGGLASPEPAFDFSGGGQFQPFSNFNNFLLLASGLEDLSVRTYSGQLPSFFGFPDTLTIIAEIHSTEARHSAHLRELRGLRAWVAGVPADAPQLAPVYAGEDAAEIGGASAEAFDQPLSRAEAQGFLAAFIR